MRRMRRILLVLLAAGLLAACGGNGGNGNGTSDSSDQAQSGDGDMSMPSASSPAAGAADRTIQVTADDQLRFEPASLSVKQGETVAFTVTNSGKLAHEYVLGDQAFQDRHHEEMAGQTMPMHDDADGIGLPVGATKTLTYTFEHPGTLYFACHVTGHYEAGMKGTITVT